MSVANEAIINANGWSKQFDVADNAEEGEKHLNFAHDVAITFKSPQGQKVLESMVKSYLLNDIVQPNDTQFSVGIKQGKASVVKYILAQIELSNNAK